MTSWNDLAGERADLAAAGREMLYQHGVGLAFLATTRPDGGPRIHPMCPLLTPEGLFAFILPSPKQRDLLRDGHYAMHSFPRPEDEDAFYIAGRARRIDTAGVRTALEDQFVEERSALPVPRPDGADVLFSFSIETCLLTRTTGHGDPNPTHTVWRPS